RASSSRTALAGGAGRPSPVIVASYDGPMKMFRHLCVLAWLLSLAACATPSSPPASSRPAAAPRSLLLVSLGGVHPDGLARGGTPHLERLAREGVRAPWMVPSYPGPTFPNPYTIVTGIGRAHV